MTTFARLRVFVSLFVLALAANAAQRAEKEISGVVRWPDGSPAAGAVVTAAHDVDEDLDFGFGLALSIFKDTSDAKGAFRIGRLTDQPWKLRAVVDAPEPSSGAVVRLPFEVEARAVAVGTKDVVLVLDAGSMVSGRVVDDRGEPVLSYSVTLEHVRHFREDGKPGFATQTTHAIRTLDGNFTIHGVRDGACLVGVEADAHVSPEEMRVDLPAKPAPLAFTMPRAARIRGIVVDALGKPVADAFVSVRAPSDRAPYPEELGFDMDLGGLVTDPDSKPRATPGEAITDANGRFDVGGIRPGKRVLRADADGHARSVPRDLDIAPASTLEDVRIALRRGATVRGVVRDSRGQPLGDVDVGVIADGGSVWQATEPDGSYRFAHVTPGEVVVVAREDRTPESVSRLEPEIIELTVTLHEGDDVEVPIGGAAPDPAARTRVTGTLRGALAVANTKVRFEPTRESAPFVETRAKADGSYEIDLVEKGRYWVVLHLPSDSLAERGLWIAEAPDQVVDFQLPGTVVRGRVVDSNGAAVRARIRVRSADLESSLDGGWSTVGTDDTAKDGTYVFEGLERGRWRMTVTPKDAASPLAPRSVVVDLTANAKHEDLVITLTPGGALEGVVKGPDGRTFAGARITARAEDGFDYDHETSAEERVTTDAAGRFRIDGLSTGAWRVRAVADGFASVESAVVRVASSETPRLELALVRAGSIEVRLEDAQGAVVRHGPGVRTSVHDANGQAWHDLEEEQYGVAIRRFGPLPPGAWTVRRGDGSRFAPVEIVVKPDEVAQVVLRERP